MDGSIIPDRISETATLTSSPKEAIPGESGLKAGYSDDNEQFKYFIKFLDQYGSELDFYPLKIAEHIIVKGTDSGGKRVCNAGFAEAHLDYKQDDTYAQAARDTKTKEIKLFSLETGGLPLQGEYILRQITQFTVAR